MHGKRVFLSLAVLALLLLALAPGQAQAPSGTVAIDLKGVAAGVGVSWGSGTLYFQGRSYPFKVDGLSVGDVGLARINATGKVYNLKNLGDFAGTYGAVGAGVAVASGMSGLTMQNQQGVMVDLTATQEGIKLNIGPQGLTITMK
jgi:hypothetical protein